jgi:Family of unknown function (DUF6247)
VTAAAAERPNPGEVPFADATPAQVRAALAAEDVPLFDAAWQASMVRATHALDLAEVFETLTACRRIARVTAALGVDGYRRMVSTAEQILTTGQRPTGTTPVAEVQARLAGRLAIADANLPVAQAAEHRPDDTSDEGLADPPGPEAGARSGTE